MPLATGQPTDAGWYPLHSDGRNGRRCTVPVPHGCTVHAASFCGHAECTVPRPLHCALRMRAVRATRMVDQHVPWSSVCDERVRVRMMCRVCTGVAYTRHEDARAKCPFFAEAPLVLEGRTFGAETGWYPGHFKRGAMGRTAYRAGWPGGRVVHNASCILHARYRAKGTMQNARWRACKMHDANGTACKMHDAHCTRQSCIMQ